jgi:HEAT repeat protein/Tfp pilus assembly protein PilF
LFFVPVLALSMSAWVAVPAELAGGDADRITALIARLRSERFADRDAAMRELRDLGAKAVPALKRLAAEGDPELSWRIKQILKGQISADPSEPMDVSKLMAQFKTEKGDRRLALMRQIADLDGKRGRAWLASLLATEQDHAVLAQALEQLSYLGGDKAECKAVHEFYDKCDEGLKGRVLWTLAGMDPVSVRPLVREALKSQDEELKHWAIRAAGRSQDRESIPVLRPLARGGDKVPRDQQLAALEALISLRDEELAKTLPPLLESEDAELFKLALRGVSTMRLPETSQTLLDLYRDPKRRSARAALITAMGAVGDQRVVPVLREALSNDRNLRYVALQALRAMNAKGSGPEILVCLNDPNDSVRQLAATVLGQLEYREAIPRLKRALNDRDRDVCLAAALALLNLGDPSGEEKILQLARQEAAQGIQGNGALEMLGTYRIEKGIPLLKQLAAEGREDALWALLDMRADKDTFRLALRQMLINRNDGSGGFGDVQLSLFYSRCHLHDRAANMLEELAKKQPGYSFLHSRLAHVYHEAGRYEAAEKAYERWSQLEPEDGTYLNNRAWFYCTAYTKAYKRPAQALALASRALAQRPEEGFIVDTYGWSLYAAGRYEEALKELRRSLSMVEPANRSGQATERVRIARALQKLGRREEALKEIQQALRDAPMDGEVWFEAAGFYAAAGRRDEAVDAIHRAVDKGYRNVASFKLNSEFESIRKDPGFQYAVRRAERDLAEFGRIADEVEKEVGESAPVPGRLDDRVRQIRALNGQVILIQ